jgi:hypothetical protein
MCTVRATFTHIPLNRLNIFGEYLHIIKLLLCDLLHHPVTPLTISPHGHSLCTYVLPIFGVEKRRYCGLLFMLLITDPCIYISCCVIPEQLPDLNFKLCHIHNLYTHCPPKQVSHPALVIISTHMKIIAPACVSVALFNTSHI